MLTKQQSAGIKRHLQAITKRIKLEGLNKSNVGYLERVTAIAEYLDKRNQRKAK